MKLVEVVFDLQCTKNITCISIRSHQHKDLVVLYFISVLTKIIAESAFIVHGISDTIYAHTCQFALSSFTPECSAK